jgi:flagellar biosynthesis protein FlhB
VADDPESKTEEPTPGKLSKAREKGDVAKSQDLPALASLAAVVSVVAAGGTWFSTNMAMGLLPFIAHPQDMDLEGHGAISVARHAAAVAAPLMVTVLICAGLAGVGGNLMQTGFLFTPDKLKPDFKKVSPLGGLKRMFGLDSLVNFLKSVVKIAMVGILAWTVMKPHIHELQMLSSLDATAILPLCVTILRKLIFAVLCLLLAVAGADWLWQRHSFMKKMRMSKEEVKEDHKQSEGDPHVKAKRRQIQVQRSRMRMMQRVPEATVVIMNPTHYAVALHYEEGEASAPQCVAKGLDALALKIRSVAEEAGVPVIEDPPLARALYAAVEVDDYIPPAHYEAVAKVIGFILQQAERRRPAKPLPA